MSKKSSKDTKQSTRKWIAFSMIGVSAALIIVLAYILVSYSTNKDEAADRLFTMLIPLIGTWVGTVLAYYFSSESYEKANEQVSGLISEIDQKLASFKTGDVMIKYENMIYLTLKTSEDGSTIKISDNVISKLTPPVTRLPFLDENKVARFIIHQSAIYQFVSEQALKGATDTSSMTMKDFLDYGNMKDLVERSIAYLGKDTNLAEVQKTMNSAPGCQDVFITDNGQKDGKVLGWITNVDISKLAK